MTVTFLKLSLHVILFSLSSISLQLPQILLSIILLKQYFCYIYIFLATFSYQTPILSFYISIASWPFSFLLLHTSFQILPPISLCFLKFLLLSKCLLLLYTPFRYFGFLLNVVYTLLFKIEKGHLGSSELSYPRTWKTEEQSSALTYMLCFYKLHRLHISDWGLGT